MNLRTKFILLIIGVTVFPFLLTGVTIALQYRLDGSKDWPPHSLPAMRKAIRENLPQFLEEGDIDSIKKMAEMGIPLIIYEDGKLIHSSIPQLGGQVSDPGRNFSIGLAVYPISIIIFASMLSLVVIRSINKSIRVLEEATREIAAGNLAFKLEPKGSDAFSSLSRSFSVMQEKLKEEQAKRSRFIMGVSHDLNTPLTLIEGYVDAINDGYADSEEKLKRYLEIIKEKSHILGNRIAQLIEFVNMETGQWKFVLKPVLLRPFLDQLAGVYRDESEIMKYEFNAVIEVPRDFSVQLDKDLIRRVFDNLIQNAVHYSGSDTTSITLGARIEGEEILLSVTNLGKGIPEEEQTHVFEPFYRGNRGQDHKGFGLGLSSVKSVVESHGWKISLSSVPGEKTVFLIHIPFTSA